jgi:hypothetical protein
VSGSPPDERRHLSLFGCTSGGALPAAPTRTRQLPDDVVGLDLADLHPSPGAELVLLRDRALELQRAADGAPLGRVALPGSAALPAPAGGVLRLHLVDAWHGDARKLALLPDHRGGLLVGFDGAPPRWIPLPLLARYDTAEYEIPSRQIVLRSSVEWPSLMLADDDGDGRADLFALSRYDIWIFRNGEEGLPAAPTRTLSLRPFTPQEELRHETTSFRHLARDLNGDGAADLVLIASAGSLMSSRSHVAVHWNPGTGALVDGDPDLELSLPGSMAHAWLEDLDADGRPELLRGSAPLGLLQVIRMMLTRSVKFDLEVLRLAGEQPGARAWSEPFAVGIDFGAGRVADLLPTTGGDWNGDGRPDLIYGQDGTLVIRLGESTPSGPGFGAPVAEQPLPTSAAHAILDLDGDERDDLVVFDPRDDEGRLHLLRNRGHLPGTPPRLESR